MPELDEKAALVAELAAVKMAKDNLLAALTSRNAELAEAERKIELLEAEAAARDPEVTKLYEDLGEAKRLLRDCPKIGSMYAQIYVLEGEELSRDQQEIKDWLDARRVLLREQPDV